MSEVDVQMSTGKGQPLRRAVGRRGIVAAVSAAAAALLLHKQEQTAQAAPGDPMRLEVENNTVSTTALTKSNANSNAALLVTAQNGLGISVLANLDVGVESTGTTGVRGSALAGGGVGVRASTTSGFGLYASAAGAIAGVYGENSGAGPGVRAFSGGAEGILAQGNPALRAESTVATGVGVRAATTNGIAMFASSTNKAGVPVYGEQTGAGTSASDVAVAVRGVATAAFGIGVEGQGVYRAAVFRGNVEIQGNFEATGTKSAVIPRGTGDAVRLYCLESPESYFEDWGRATLQHGAATVNIDPEFASVVNLSDYLVFLTPEKECAGLYVDRSQSSQNSFVVRELLGGQSSGVSFTWRLLAKRRDVEAQRLQTVKLTPNTRPATPEQRELRPIPNIPPELRDDRPGSSNNNIRRR